MQSTQSNCALFSSLWSGRRVCHKWEALANSEDLRLGEIIREQKETVGLATGGERGGRAKIDGTRAEPSISVPTLADAGIDKKLSSRAQKLASVHEPMLRQGYRFVAEGAQINNYVSPLDIIFNSGEIHSNARHCCLGSKEERV